MAAGRKPEQTEQGTMGNTEMTGRACAKAKGPTSEVGVSQKLLIVEGKYPDARMEKG